LAVQNKDSFAINALIKGAASQQVPDGMKD
jgi:hypothetical protein